MKIKLKKIHCPIDFSENSKHSLGYALTLAKYFHAELILVYVVDSAMMVLLSGGLTQQIEKDQVERLENWSKEIKETHNRVSVRFVYGTPFLEIVKLARAEDADMIVMGTHGRTGLAHVLIGSVAEKVVRMAPCPVLTVKHPEHEFVMP